MAHGRPKVKLRLLKELVSMNILNSILSAKYCQYCEYSMITGAKLLTYQAKCSHTMCVFVFLVGEE
jgi:hypothetical protein